VEVVCPKQTVILAWNQFVYAEGSDDEIRLAFASHDVIVKGAGLLPLLQAITTQQVIAIRQSIRRAAFPGPAARFIREIEVRRVDAD
jgi:hypothetical protein